MKDPLMNYLIDGGDIDVECQSKWFESLDNRQDYFVWGVEADKVPIGVVGLKHIDYKAKTGEYFGYIGEKKFWGMGIGKKMLDFICSIAFNMGLSILELNVLEDNIRAIKLYERYGFDYKKGAVSEQHLMHMFLNLESKAKSRIV